MGKYSSEDIRNLALVGHAGSGKTELAEALLHQAGALKSRGSLERGTTVCDFDPQEKQLGHSLDTAICSFDHDGKHINLVDTPGYPDLCGRALGVLAAVETAAVVINAQAGIETIAEKMMESAGKRGLDRVIIVNKIDAQDVDLERLLEEIRENFGGECLPINLPADSGSAVIDCFFKPTGNPTDLSSVEQAHTEIIDQVVELDEGLMSLYLEQGEELTPEQVHDPFEKALREGHLIPVCFVSARTGAGVAQLLEIIDKLLPNPSEANPPPFIKGEGENAMPVDVTPDSAGHAIAHVFKVTIDPFIGKMAIFRVHQGGVAVNGQLFIGDARKPFKITHLHKLMGKENSEISKAIPGDICAVTKVDDIHFDAVLHDSHDEDYFHLRSMVFDPPMLGLAIEPIKRGDEQKLSDALHKLQEEDPGIRIEHNPDANETVLRGMGDLHLRILLERMKDHFHVEVKSHPPTIAFAETITAEAEGQHRHKKQTGGAGQFGEVSLKICPLDRGAGIEFINKVVGGAIPSQFILAVEKGVRQAIRMGAIAGYPLEDLRVTVYDGKHHAVDSKEVAFVAAGKKAFLDAVRKAHPIVLEPIVNINISVSGEKMGDITGDLAGRRGRVNGSEAKSNGKIVVSGQAPLAELENYQSSLKSMTGGDGTYSMEFSHYEQVPAVVQKQLCAAFQPREE